MSNLIHTVIYLEDSKGIEHTVNVQAYYFPVEPATQYDDEQFSYFEIINISIKGIEFDVWELSEFLENKTAEDLEDYITEKLIECYDNFIELDDFQNYLKYK